MSEEAGPPERPSSRELMEQLPPGIYIADEVQICPSSIEHSLGIWSRVPISSGQTFGPFEGERVQEAHADMDPSYVWEIVDLETKEHLWYIDATDPKHGNWMRYIKSARFFEEQNIVSVQEGTDIYYRAIKDIEPGEELLTWYEKVQLKGTRRKRQKGSVSKTDVDAKDDDSQTSVNPKRQKREYKRHIKVSAVEKPRHNKQTRLSTRFKQFDQPTNTCDVENNETYDSVVSDDSSDGEQDGFYQFDVKAEHEVKNQLGKKVFKCDICSGLYRHSFSLKRHYIRNHINIKYVSKADLLNCGITADSVTSSKRRISDTLEGTVIVDSGEHVREGLVCNRGVVQDVEDCLFEADVDENIQRTQSEKNSSSQPDTANNIEGMAFPSELVKENPTPPSDVVRYKDNSAPPSEIVKKNSTPPSEEVKRNSTPPPEMDKHTENSTPPLEVDKHTENSTPPSEVDKRTENSTPPSEEDKDMKNSTPLLVVNSDTENATLLSEVIKDNSLPLSEVDNVTENLTPLSKVTENSTSLSEVVKVTENYTPPSEVVKVTENSTPPSEVVKLTENSTPLSEVVKVTENSTPLSEVVKVTENSTPLSEVVKVTENSTPLSEVVKVTENSTPPSEVVKVTENSTPLLEVVKLAENSTPLSEDVKLNCTTQNRVFCDEQSSSITDDVENSHFTENCSETQTNSNTQIDNMDVNIQCESINDVTTKEQDRGISQRQRSGTCKLDSIIDWLGAVNKHRVHEVVVDNGVKNADEVKVSVNRSMDKYHVNNDRFNESGVKLQDNRSKGIEEVNRSKGIEEVKVTYDTCQDRDEIQVTDRLNTVMIVPNDLETDNQSEVSQQVTDKPDEEKENVLPNELERSRSNSISKLPLLEIESESSGNTQYSKGPCNMVPTDPNKLLNQYNTKDESCSKQKQSGNKDDNMLTTSDDTSIVIVGNKDDNMLTTSDDTSIVIVKSGEHTENNNDHISDYINTKKHQGQIIDPEISKDNSIDPETSKDNSIDPETSKDKSIDPETSKDNSIDPETSKDKSIDPETSKDNSIDPETSKDNSIDPETSKDKSIDPETSKHNSIDPETSKDKSIDPETSKDKSIDPETSKDKSIDPETSKDKNINPETSKDNSIDPETSKDKNINPETSKDKSIDPETSKDNSIDPETSKDNSIDPETSKDKSIDPETSKHNSIDPETSKDNSIDPETSKDKSIDPETSKDKSIDPETSKDKNINQETSKDNSIDPETSKDNSIDPETSKDISDSISIYNKEQKQCKSSQSELPWLPGLYRCNICDALYDTVIELKDHIKHHPIDSEVATMVSCDCCDMKFTHRKHLMRHQAVHTATGSNKRHNCRHCNKVFSTAKNKKRHEKLHEASRYTCEHCATTFTQSGDLKKHICRHHPTCFHQCAFCPNYFSRKSNLREHLVIHKKSLTENTQEVSKKRDGIEFIDSELDRSESMKIVVEKYGRLKDPYKYACTVCKKLFIDYSNMCRHRRLAHKRHLLDVVRTKVKKHYPIMNRVSIIRTRAAAERESDEFYTNIATNIHENLTNHMMGTRKMIDEAPDIIKWNVKSATSSFHVKKEPIKSSYCIPMSVLGKFNFPKNFKWRDPNNRILPSLKKRARSQNFTLGNEDTDVIDEDISGKITGETRENMNGKTEGGTGTDINGKMEGGTRTDKADGENITKDDMTDGCVRKTSVLTRCQLCHSAFDNIPHYKEHLKMVHNIDNPPCQGQVHNITISCDRKKEAFVRNMFCTKPAPDIYVPVTLQHCKSEQDQPVDLTNCPPPKLSAQQQELPTAHATSPPQLLPYSEDGAAICSANHMDCLQLANNPRTLTSRSQVRAVCTEDPTEKYHRYLCVACQQVFSDWMTLRSHHERSHPTIEYDFSIIDPSLKQVWCRKPSPLGVLDVCASQLPPQEYLSRQPYKCTKCSKRLKNRHSLHMHITECADPESLRPKYVWVYQYRKHKYSKLKKRTCEWQKNNNSPKKMAAYSDVSNDGLSAIQGLQTPDKLDSLSHPTTPTSDLFMDEINKKKQRRKPFELLYNPNRHTRRREMTEVVDSAICNGCGVDYDSISQLERHIPMCSHKEKIAQDSSGDSSDEDDYDPNKHLCIYCLRQFTYLRSLRKHMLDICTVRKEFVKQGEYLDEEWEEQLIKKTGGRPEPLSRRSSTSSLTGGQPDDDNSQDSVDLKKSFDYDKKRRRKRRGFGWAQKTKGNGYTKTIKRVESKDGFVYEYYIESEIPVVAFDITDTFILDKTESINTGIEHVKTKTKELTSPYVHATGYHDDGSKAEDLSKNRVATADQLDDKSLCVTEDNKQTHGQTGVKLNKTRLTNQQKNIKGRSGNSQGHINTQTMLEKQNKRQSGKGKVVQNNLVNSSKGNKLFNLKRRNVRHKGNNDGKHGRSKLKADIGRTKLEKLKTVKKTAIKCKGIGNRVSRSLLKQAKTKQVLSKSKNVKDTKDKAKRTNLNKRLNKDKKYCDMVSENNEITVITHVSKVEKISKKIAGNISKKAAGNTPQKMAGNTSQKMAGNTPKKMAGNTPQKMAGNTPKKMAGNTSQKMAGNTSQKMAGNTPKKMAGNMSQKMAGNTLKKMTEKVNTKEETELERKIQKINKTVKVKPKKSGVLTPVKAPRKTKMLKSIEKTQALRLAEQKIKMVNESTKKGLQKKIMEKNLKRKSIFNGNRGGNVWKKGVDALEPVNILDDVQKTINKKKPKKSTVDYEQVNKPQVQNKQVQNKHVNKSQIQNKQVSLLQNTKVNNTYINNTKTNVKTKVKKRKSVFSEFTDVQICELPVQKTNNVLGTSSAKKSKLIKLSSDDTFSGTIEQPSISRSEHSTPTDRNTTSSNTESSKILTGAKNKVKMRFVKDNHVIGDHVTTSKKTFKKGGIKTTSMVKKRTKVCDNVKQSKYMDEMDKYKEPKQNGDSPGEINNHAMTDVDNQTITNVVKSKTMNSLNSNKDKMTSDVKKVKAIKREGTPHVATSYLEEQVVNKSKQSMFVKSVGDKVRRRGVQFIDEDDL